MSICDVQYQAHAQRIVQCALAGDCMPHAYLFHGPDGVGKETLALGLAETLLCPNSIEKAIEGGNAEMIGMRSVRLGCGHCEDCRSVAAQTHPDLHLIHRHLSRLHPDAAVRARKALEIGVDVLRHFVIEKVRLTPQRGRAKVFIVRDADRITTQAQNALLKTLEEPPIDTILILCAAAVDRLLPTTRSRCQLVRFDTLPRPFIREKLRALLPTLDHERADWYARYGGGSIGRALQCAANDLYDINRIVVNALASLEPGGAAGVIEVWTGTAKSLANAQREHDAEITDTEANRRGLKELLQLTANYYADALHEISISGAAATLADRNAQRNTPGGLNLAAAGRAISRIAEAERHLDLNVNVQLVVETLGCDLAKLTSGAIPAG